MWSYLWPILVLICANVTYHVTAKSIPGALNAFLPMALHYLICGVLAFGAYWLVDGHRLGEQLRLLNWTSLVMPFALIGLELGSIFMYRAGWNISVGSTIANIAVAVVLVFVGAMLFAEKITLRQIGGIVLCMAGLALINTK